MSNKIKICDCSICFESLDMKSFDTSIQFDCGHYFHNKCIKPWCNKCIMNNLCPTCPVCRQIISDEYLDILNIDYCSKFSIFEKIRMYNSYEMEDD